MNNNCVFCKIAAGEIPSFTIYEDEEFKVFLDISPATRGHMLVIPRTHCADIFEIDAGMCARLHKLTVAMAARIRGALNTDALNVLQNNGPLAGQTVRHYHVHLIPRYENDGADLIPAQTEVSGSALAELAEKLRRPLPGGHQ
ncbi:MAG: HIT family protein [Clostridiales bacterium]|jgi:histidine triad (HIT) family protein|nr:HIT family protein [Clostridiales bacterium]